MGTVVSAKKQTKNNTTVCNRMARIVALANDFCDAYSKGASLSWLDYLVEEIEKHAKQTRKIIATTRVT